MLIGIPRAIAQGSRRKQGFTIVELLIVIVVIGILAAISIVAYSGIQERGRYSSYQSDISAMNKAILLYAVDNGVYPSNGGAPASCTTRNASDTNEFIVGLVPTYLPKTPYTPNSSGGANYYAYCWTTGGTNYKILRLVPAPGPVPAIELGGNTIADPNRGNRGWGYWSPGGSGL